MKIQKGWSRQLVGGRLLLAVIATAAVFMLALVLFFQPDLSRFLPTDVLPDGVDLASFEHGPCYLGRTATSSCVPGVDRVECKTIDDTAFVITGGPGIFFNQASRNALDLPGACLPPDEFRVFVDQDTARVPVTGPAPGLPANSSLAERQEFTLRQALASCEQALGTILNLCIPAVGGPPGRPLQRLLLPQQFDYSAYYVNHRHGEAYLTITPGEAPVPHVYTTVWCGKAAQCQAPAGFDGAETVSTSGPPSPPVPLSPLAVPTPTSF